MTDRIKALEDALEWCAEQARLARLIHNEGDAGRHALAADGGNRARAALAAPQPAQGEAATWCQPMDCGKHTPRVWLIRFEDQSVGDLTFDNEAEARRMWEKYNHGWNCYLMASLPLLAASQPSPDCHQPDLVTADSSQPAQPVAWVEKQELEYLRMVTCNKGWGGYQRAIMVGGEKEGCAPLYAAIQPLTVQDAALVPEIAALIEGGAGIKRIVEEIDGAMSHGNWRDENGGRLKDTPEWVAFYNALSALRAIAEGRA